MFFIPDPKIFTPEEIFPPHIIAAHTDKNGNIGKHIWRLMNSRILWTAVQLRGLFGTMIINDYPWGGKNSNRGYRDPISLIDVNHFMKTGDIRAQWSSFTSQHCFGNGIDSTFKKILAHEVRKYIIDHSTKDEFKYITAMEKEVTWLHFDGRNFTNGNDKIFIF